MSHISHIDYVTHAAWFAAMAHKDQKRDGNQEPYFMHVARVASAVAHNLGFQSLQYNRTPDTVAAAYLHDVMEDCGYTFCDLVDQGFREPTVLIVEELTDDPSWPREARKKLQAEKMSKASHEACLVKLCDQTDNLEGLQAMLAQSWEDRRSNMHIVARSRRYIEGASLVVGACIDRIGNNLEIYPARSQYENAIKKLTKDMELYAIVPVQGDGPQGAPEDRRRHGVISWAEHLLVYEAYAAKYGRSQTPERIAERGGFGRREAEALLGRDLETWRAR